MKNFLGVKYIFRNLNEKEEPWNLIKPRKPDANEELWTFIKCGSRTKNKKYQFTAFTKSFEVLLKNISSSGFIVVETEELLENVNSEMIHDCSTKEKVYYEANKYPKKKERKDTWYEIAASYAVASKEVDIARETILPKCYFYVSKEELMSVVHENLGNIPEFELKDNYESVLPLILRNHCIGEKIELNTVEKNKFFYKNYYETMLKIDKQFSKKRLNIGLKDLPFKERFLESYNKLIVSWEKNGEKDGLSFEEFEKRKMEDIYEGYMLFKKIYLYSNKEKDRR